MTLESTRLAERGIRVSKLGRRVAGRLSTSATSAITSVFPLRGRQRRALRRLRRVDHVGARADG